MSDKLKPCPWCGHPLAISLVTDCGVFAAYCGHCGCEGPREGSVAAATVSANNRPTAWRNSASDLPPTNRPVLVRYPGKGHEFIWYHYRLPEPGLVYEWCEVAE